MGLWGYALIASVLAVTTEAGRGIVKSVLKASIKVSMEAKEHFDELAEKAKDYKEELMTEIKSETAEAEVKKAVEKDTVISAG